MRADFKPAPTIMEIVAQNGRHILDRGFNPCFVEGAHDGDPEGVKQNGDIWRCRLFEAFNHRQMPIIQGLSPLPIIYRPSGTCEI